MLDPGLHRRTFFASWLALAALAWAMLALWAASPWGRYLEHGGWTEAGLLGAICAALPAGGVLVPAALYTLGWMLMIAAMMLPTTLPLLAIYTRMAQRRPDRTRLVGLVIGGYLAAWGGFGLAAHAADLGVQALVRSSPWLTFNGWALGATVLALAGSFQFSNLKRRCLARCRMPMGFVLEHWRGRAAGRAALRLGWRHGLYCVGCCWALMLIMFLVGTGSLGWMLLLGLVMAAEKNLPLGRRLSAPLGVLLLAGSAGVVAANLLRL